MSYALTLFNHAVNFFVLPLLWAVLLSGLAGLLFRRHAQQCGTAWWRRMAWAALWALPLTLAALFATRGQSSILYYALLGGGLLTVEAVQLRLWR